MFHKALNERNWASNVEGKIYSGLDASRILYFRNGRLTFPKDALDLIPEYFEMKRERYLVKIKDIAGAVYNEARSKERFKEIEVENAIAEIEAAKKEFVNAKNSISKSGIQSYRTAMEIYLDWLNELIEKAPELVLHPSALKYFKPIPQTQYFLEHAKDESTMALYEQGLQQSNPQLKLTTTIYELPSIYGVITKWDDILA